MADDQVFMYREDWLGQNGEPFCKVFCPVSTAERVKRLRGNDKRQFVDVAEHESPGSMHMSALQYRYDWDLHQMVAYMRRLDGATLTLTRQKRMDPMERMGVTKWRTDGSRTAFFWILDLHCLGLCFRPRPFQGIRVECGCCGRRGLGRTSRRDSDDVRLDLEQLSYC